MMTVNTCNNKAVRATGSRRVRFAEEIVSHVCVVERKTSQEALTLFYQQDELDRFRAEARIEKLTKGLEGVDQLNVMMQFAQMEFKSPICNLSGTTTPLIGVMHHHHAPMMRQTFSRGARRTAGIA